MTHVQVLHGGLLFIIPARSRSAQPGPMIRRSLKMTLGDINPGSTDPRLRVRVVSYELKPEYERASGLSLLARQVLT